MSATQAHRNRTLALAGVLHAFTHAYQMALIPLYLAIQTFYGRAKVGDATLLVTAMLVAYFLPSYPMGMLADRVSRKKLLSCGLAINALGFIGLALAPSYPMALACVIIAGFGGSFFHPAATALVARLYPKNTGRALGFLGIGASVGFCIGPLYAGWRAKETGDWRWPVCELGILGLIFAGMFAWLADEHAASDVSLSPQRGEGRGEGWERGEALEAQKSQLHHHPSPSIPLPVEGRGKLDAPRSSVPTREPMFPTPALWFMFIAAAFIFLLRDFTGSSMGTVGSLFLQKARGFDVEQTGFTISFIFIASAISNPLFGHFSDRARLKWAAAMIIISAVFVALFPHVPQPWIIPILLVYGFFFMASYPIVEAALMESVPDAVRGRVFGLFITIGGLLGNLSHWIDGKWVERFGEGANEVRTYYSLYGWLAVFLLASLAGLPCLHAIRKREEAVHPGSTHHAEPTAP
ncbi:MAG TPA: MFS transporter [Methylomirabilota bacterium]|nr:MFS transporter [Methylomirabilota bacterium]